MAESLLDCSVDAVGRKTNERSGEVGDQPAQSPSLPDCRLRFLLSICESSASLRYQCRHGAGAHHVPHPAVAGVPVVVIAGDHKSVLHTLVSSVQSVLIDRQVDVADQGFFVERFAEETYSPGPERLSARLLVIMSSKKNDRHQAIAGD
jgi:hypothetical protein